jgi:hypothetical protein
MQYTKIVKLASGNVQLQNASNSPVKTLQPAANLELLPDDAGVRVKQWQGENTDILISQVAFTRLDPAADVAFAGTAQDLMTLLGDSFFFELEGNAALMDGYQSSSYHAFISAYSTANSNFVLVANRIEGIIVEIKYPCTLESAKIRVTAAVAGSAVVGLYKYDVDTDAWELVAQTDPASPFNLGVVSEQEVAYTAPVTIEAGIYASVILANSTATIYSLTRPAASTYFGFFSAISTTADQSSVSLNLTYTATLPSAPTFVIGYRSGGLLPLLLHKTIA